MWHDYEDNYVKYADGSGGGYQDSLPEQTIPMSKKNKDWNKATMDRLENIGLRQLRENRRFADYRDMREGRLVHQDIGQTDLQGIESYRKEIGIDTYLKHHDLIGVIIRTLTGSYDRQEDDINIHAKDVFSKSDYLREKDKRISAFTEEYFEKEIQIGLIEKGIDPFKNKFETEQEKQKYLQQLKQERDKIIPPSDIERDMQKDFRPSCIEWAESKLKSNYKKYNLKQKDQDDLKDTLTVGRYFTDYYVGYDSFNPERWNVEQVFFSQDLDVMYPQECEYVGYIDYMSGSRFLSKYGHMITKKQQEKIYGYKHRGSSSINVSPQQYVRRMGEPVTVPHKGYHNRQAAQGFQNLTGLPMARKYHRNQEGDLEARYDWLTAANTTGDVNWGSNLRNDLNVRTDSLRLTKAYFRSKKLVGLLTVDTGFTEKPYQTFVEEDLLDEVLDYYDIKKQSTKTWQEVTENPEDHINTITYGYLDEIWQGYKLSATGTGLKEDLYFGIKPLDYQIPGKNNEFELLLPVAGIITNGIGQILRSVQIEYNLVRNQITQYMEKTLGSFLSIDWRMLPSQFKNEHGETTADLIGEWRDTIEEFGIAATDQGKQNIKGLDSGNNTQVMEISFVKEIQSNIKYAQYLKQEAMELIGITPEMRGAPSEYQTAEGIRQGMDASYAQTSDFYKDYDQAKIEEKNLELAISHHCELNNKDVSVDYIGGQNSRIIRNFTNDPNFSFRKFEIYAANDASDRRDVKMLKNQILQRNTLDSDVYEMSKVMQSKSFTTLMEYGLKQRKRLEEKEQQKHQREQQLKKMEIDAENKRIKDERDRQDKNKQLDRESEEYQTEIDAMARLADGNTNPGLVKELRDAQNEEKNRRDSERKDSIKQKELEIKDRKADAEIQKAQEEVNMKMLELRERAKDRAQRRESSENKVEVAKINPG